MCVQTLVDELFIITKARSQNKLCEYLGVNASTLTKLLKGSHNVGPTFILQVYDATSLSIEEIRELLAKPSRKSLL